MLEKIKIIIRHNQFTTVALIIILGICLWTFGCESSIKSPITGQKVTRNEFRIEQETLIKQIELATLALDNQDLFKQQIIDVGLVIGTGGSVNPAGLITTLVGLVGVGSVVDNRRKDALIKMLQNNIGNNNATSY